jgi:hypothetical protein
MLDYRDRYRPRRLEEIDDAGVGRAPISEETFHDFHHDIGNDARGVD